MIYNLKKLRGEQIQLSKKVSLENDIPEDVKTVGGFDLAYSGKTAYSAGVVFDFETLELMEKHVTKMKINFPYIPTFLAFREYKPIVEVYKKLKNKPDVLLINGQGIAHPLRIGLASHVGVMLDKPTIGVAQKKLVGNYKEPKIGEYSKLFHNGEQIGWVYRSKKQFKPIFISPGHKVSLFTSIGIVLNCMRDHKLPEPLWKAHTLSVLSKTNL